MEKQQHREEISLQEIVDLIREYVIYLWSKKWYILAASILGGAIFFTREYKKPTTYTAELTFMINEENGSSMGGAAALLGQFGLGNRSGGALNLKKVIELSKSRKIAQNVLFDSLSIGETYDFTANHLIELYDYHDKWSDSESLRGFLFSKSKLEDFSKLEKSVAKSLLKRLIGTSESSGIIDLNFEESTGILSLKVVSKSSDLSIALSESMFKHLSNFYVKQSTEKQQFTLELLEVKADSVGRALYKAEYALAKLRDNSQGFRLRTTQLEEQQLNREIQILTLTYGEILKNKATTEFILESVRPFFQVIDRPIEPISRSTKNYIFSVFLGSLVLPFFLILYFLIRKILFEKPI